MSACTACGAEQTKQEPFWYDWEGRTYWLRRCSSCTHQFVDPPISVESQRSIYDDEYFSSSGDWVCGLFSGKAYEEATRELVAEAKEILAFLPVQEGSLLDIGCAGGVFLGEARSAGFSVRGIEINANQAESARERFGVEVINERIEDVSDDLGPFDVVTLLDVLEHIPQPLDTVRKVARWVRPGGHLLIRGPMMNSRAARVKERLRRLTGLKKRLPGYPLDANVFNRRSITAMLGEAGFEVCRMDAKDGFANVLSVRV